MARKAYERARGRSAAAGGSSRRVKLAWLAALAGSTALAALPETALADCENPIGSTWVCSGANTAIQIIPGDNVTVMTLPGFSVDSDGDALWFLLNGGATSYIDDASSPLTGGHIALHFNGISDVVGAPASVTARTNGTIIGGETGIAVNNEGSGAVRITAGGPVRGLSDTGILVSRNTGTDITIEAADVTGGQNGIAVNNEGSGEVRITASGPVQGLDAIGIWASNTGTDITIETADVTGGRNGIFADNRGSGATRITASGRIEGLDATGIWAETVSDGDLAIETADVVGGQHGIGTQNSGSGVTSITTTGMVQGRGGNGILASTISLAPSALTINAVDVSGEANGIEVIKFVEGTTTITATGLVTGASENGIHVTSLGAAGDITINAANVTGATNGIRTGSTGATTSITTNGLVEGGTLAVSAASSTGQPIDVHNLAGGTLRNTSGASSDAAVWLQGGAVTLVNEADIIGTVSLDGAVARFENNGVWNGTGGTSQFGGGAGSELVNAAGAVVVGGGNGAIAETTVLADLPMFINRGEVTLVDGGAGDVIMVGEAADFQTGSELSVDVGGAGGADRFVSTDPNGEVALNGATLNVSRIGALEAGVRYVVLTADGGLTGTFDAITGIAPTAFLTIRDDYDANNAWLETLIYRDFADAGATPNQIATGRGLDTIPPGAPLYVAVANLPTDAAAQAAFDQLSGEIHASARTAMLEDSRFVRNAVNDRIRAAFDGVGAPSMPLMAYGEDGPRHVSPTTGRFGAWGQAFGSWGRRDGNGNAARLDRSIGGFLFGADATVLDTWRFGVVAGYSRTGFEVRDRNASGSSDNYHLGLYGGTVWGDLALRTGAAYTWHDISTGRFVAFPGFADSLGADYQAGTAQVFGELAYAIRAGSFAFEPFASLAYVHLHADGFAETGNGAALAGGSAGTDATFTTLGLRAATSLEFAGTAATLKGMIGWRHAFGDAAPEARMRFAGGDVFAIGGVPLARDAAVVEAGLDLTLSPAATLGVSYGGQFGSGFGDHSVRTNLHVRF